MSVIVKCMKMPDCCAVCKLCDYDDGGIYCNALEVFMSFDELPEGRRSDCPLEGLIRCKDCIYYDPPHIENDGQRYEYNDMPPEAFDPITTKYVSVAYGINMGGRCCRDYGCGYSEDKRVFVTETNYCGRAERRGEE